MTRWDQNRPIGWFPPWLEWLGSLVVYLPAGLALVISVVVAWILRCRGE